MFIKTTHTQYQEFKPFVYKTNNSIEMHCEDKYTLTFLDSYSAFSKCLKEK